MPLNTVARERNTYVAPVGRHDSSSLPPSIERKRKDSKGETPWSLEADLPITIDHRTPSTTLKQPAPPAPTPSTRHHHHPQRECTTLTDTRTSSRKDKREDEEEPRRGRNRRTGGTRDGEGRCVRERGQIERKREAKTEEDGERKRVEKRRARRNRKTWRTDRTTNESFDEASSPTARSEIREERGERYGGASFRTKLGPWRRAGDPRGTPPFPLFLRLLVSSRDYVTRSSFDRAFPSSSDQRVRTVLRLALPFAYAYRLLSFIRFVQSSPILRIASRPLAVRPRPFLHASAPGQTDRRERRFLSSFFSFLKETECLESLGKHCLLLPWRWLNDRRWGRSG